MLGKQQLCCFLPSLSVVLFAIKSKLQHIDLEIRSDSREIEFLQVVQGVLNAILSACWSPFH